MIWHMKALDDPLNKKIKEVEEMIKDEPGSEDPIYLMEFNLRRKKEKEAEEAQMWAGIESQVEAEETARREFEMKQKQKQESAGKPLDESQSADVWNKLGIDVPLQPVERIEAPPVVIENQENPDLLLIDKSIEAPDWELVEKMSKLAEPTEGVPEAPDLDSISEEE